MNTTTLPGQTYTDAAAMRLAMLEIVANRTDDECRDAGLNEAHATWPTLADECQAHFMDFVHYAAACIAEMIEGRNAARRAVLSAMVNSDALLTGRGGVKLSDD